MSLPHSQRSSATPPRPPIGVGARHVPAGRAFLRALRCWSILAPPQAGPPGQIIPGRRASGLACTLTSRPPRIDSDADALCRLCGQTQHAAAPTAARWRHPALPVAANRRPRDHTAARGPERSSDTMQTPGVGTHWRLVQTTTGRPRAILSAWADLARYPAPSRPDAAAATHRRRSGSEAAPRDGTKGD